MTSETARTGGDWYDASATGETVALVGDVDDIALLVLRVQGSAGDDGRPTGEEVAS